MVQGGLLTAHPGGFHGDGETPEVNPPSGRVPGQGLLVAPILKRRRRRNGEGIAKKGSAPSQRGARGGPRGSGAPLRGHPLERATRVHGPLVFPLGSLFVIHEGSSLLFFINFPKIYWAL